MVCSTDLTDVTLVSDDTYVDKEDSEDDEDKKMKKVMKVIKVTFRLW